MAPLFPNDTVYAGLIAVAVAGRDVPASLVQAVIAPESRFVASAERPEPHLADASRGLMQLLYTTARDELGFMGAPEALFSPSVNIPLGVRYLALQRQRVGGGWAEAVSAYNGGYRPDLGFGRRATRPLRICLRRAATGECAEWRAVPVGEFANQAYVDAVFRYWEHYRTLGPAAPVAAAAAPRQAGCLGVGGAALAVLWWVV